MRLQPVGQVAERARVSDVASVEVAREVRDFVGERIPDAGLLLGFGVGRGRDGVPLLDQRVEIDHLQVIMQLWEIQFRVWQCLGNKRRKWELWELFRSRQRPGASRDLVRTRDTLAECFLRCWVRSWLCSTVGAGRAPDALTRPSGERRGGLYSPVFYVPKVTTTSRDRLGGNGVMVVKVVRRNILARPSWRDLVDGVLVWVQEGFGGEHATMAILGCGIESRGV